jgi:hypothetical protein
VKSAFEKSHLMTPKYWTKISRGRDISVSAADIPDISISKHNISTPRYFERPMKMQTFHLWRQQSDDQQSYHSTCLGSAVATYYHL